MNYSSLHILELSTHDKSMDFPVAYKKDNPDWNSIEKALKSTLLHDGYVRIRIVKPEDSYIKQITLNAIDTQFKITALTGDQDPKKEYLEWWVPGDLEFKQMISFEEDNLDARQVSNDITLAKKIFFDFYKNGQLSPENLTDFRSAWNPKPKENALGA